MRTETQQLIIHYPDDFPISGPLREVFTERLKTFFEGCNTWSCSSDGSLPEKLLKLRKEMQESIGYPPSELGPSESDVHVDEWGALPIAGNTKVVLPEELLSWKGLQAKSMKDLSPVVRNAGLEMASRILGLQIHYGYAFLANSADRSLRLRINWVGTTALDLDEAEQPGFIPQALCPFTRPGVISNLTKTWSPIDRARLRHQVKKHVAIAAGVAFIVGIVLGAVLTPSGNTTVITAPGDYHHEATAERSYPAPHRQGLLPHAGPVPQPSQSALIAQPIPNITPSPVSIASQGIQPTIQGLHPGEGSH